MRRMTLVIGSVLVLSGAAVVVGKTTQMRRAQSGEEPEPSRCISEATLQLTVTPPAVAYGQATVAKWNVSAPSGCSGLRVRFNGDAVATNGSRSIVPPVSAVYRLLVSETRGGVYAERSASANVQVSYLPRVVIGPNTQHPVAVLRGALESGNESQIVELCDVEIDMTGITGVNIGDNRSLIASPNCARSMSRLGPKIFVTDRRGRAPLFVIRGDNVLVSGFRLQGPSPDIMQGDIKEKGIVISPFASPAPIRNIEISNMEIFHWSGLGIQVIDNIEQAQRGRLFNTNEAAVRIKGNFFHHNRHGAGEGYGVDVSAGAYALIEQNVFDENRHGIAGGSKHKDGNDYSGYTARDNLIFPGGGKHCSEHWGFGFLGWRGNCWQTHQVDMHGDQNEWYSDNNWLCGTAGETIIIQRNTILYTSGHAIKIRGNPADKAVVDNNVFKDSSRGHAIAQTGYCGFGDNITKPIDVRPNNVFGVDPTKELGACDFNGDGVEDQFMATGVTWWAKSGATDQWYYLNTMPEKLPQLQFGKFDNDNECDVALRTARPEMLPEKYSKSGRSPWKSRTIISR